MSTSADGSSDDRLDAELGLAFSPIHKRALGIAVGSVAGIGVFLITAWSLVVGDAPAIVYLLHYFLPGHAVSWSGAVLGALSAAFAFFVAAWFLAFCRNFVIAASVWMARTRAELAQTRDFLDHI